MIYRTAEELGATKIALGHHRDDMVETLFLNLFHAARLKGMPPKLLTNDRRHVVIRPLAYCAEADIAKFARGMEYPIIPCTLCGTQPRAQRAQIKAMLQDWERANPGRLDTIFRAMQDIRPRSWPTAVCSTSPGLKASARPCPTAATTRRCSSTIPAPTRCFPSTDQPLSRRFGLP